MTTIEQAKAVEQRLRERVGDGFDDDEAADTIASLIAELEAAQMALRSALYLIDENKLTCHHLHHYTKDFHEWDEPCGVEVKAKQRLESIRAAIANHGETK